jgi:hypothetical protein
LAAPKIGDELDWIGPREKHSPRADVDLRLQALGSRARLERRRAGVADERGDARRRRAKLCLLARALAEEQAPRGEDERDDARRQSYARFVDRRRKRP